MEPAVSKSCQFHHEIYHTLVYTARYTPYEPGHNAGNRAKAARNNAPASALATMAASRLAAATVILTDADASRRGIKQIREIEENIPDSAASADESTRRT